MRVIQEHLGLVVLELGRPVCFHDGALGPAVIVGELESESVDVLNYESPAMWQLYSHEERGIAIVSSPRRLRDAVDTSDFDHSLLAPVEYLDSQTHDMSLPRGLVARAGFTKRIEFRHEHEVRGMVRVSEVSDDSSRLLDDERIALLESTGPLGVAVPVNLEILIDHITLSPECQDWFRELVNLYLVRHGLQDRAVPSTLRGLPTY